MKEGGKLKENEIKRVNKRNMYIYISLLILSIFIIANSFGFSSNNKFGYQINKSTDYKVGVKKNNFFSDEYLQKDQTYISSIINKILMDFNYKFVGTENKNIEYSYDISTIMNVSYTNTNEKLWSKKDVIVEKDNIKLEDTKEFNIIENVEIDYNAYNNMAKQFKANFNIPIDSRLEVKLTVRQKIDDEEINEVSSVSLSMNLNEDIIKINQTKSGNDTLKPAEKQEANKFVLTIGIIIFAISMTLISKLTAGKLGFKNTKSEYDKAIKKILKNYGDVVAEIVKPVELKDNMQIIDVRNFDQLLDVEEELRMPILFYEIEKGQEGCFIIINDNIAYRYVLKNKKRRYNKE